MSTKTKLLCHNFGGIRERNAVFTSDMISAADIQNVELYYTGVNGGVGIRTADGNMALKHTYETESRSPVPDDEKVINIFETTQGEQTYFLVHTENDTEGKLYILETDNSLTLKKDGLTVKGVSNGFDIAQGWSDLFFFTNGEDMFTLEIGADEEIVDMSLTDVDGRTVSGIIAALFDGRLFICKDNVIWYSMKADVYDFATEDTDWTTSAGYIETVKNITAIYPYLGSLAIFYADSSELLSVDTDSGEFSRSEESPGGCANFRSLVFHNTDLYFYDNTKRAVFSFKQIVSGEKVLGDNLAVEVQDELLKIDTADTDKIFAQSVFAEGRNEIWFHIPIDDDYSIVLIYDYLKGEWVKRKCQLINAAATVRGKLYTAGNDGSILEEYTGSDFNGEYIEHYYYCSPFDMSAVNTLKVLCFPPRVSMDMSNYSCFYVKYRKNYDAAKTPKVKFIKSKLKKLAYYDTESYYDVDYYPPKTQNAIYKFPSATFKTLEIYIYTTEAKQDFSIRNIEFSKIKVKQV